MACSYSVYAHFTKLFHFSFHSIPVECCTKTAKVVMFTATVNFNVSVVQEKSLIGCKLNFSETEIILNSVNNFPVTDKFSFKGIKIRIFNIPEGYV